MAKILFSSDMYFTHPTGKTYIVNAHVSQQEMLNMLMQSFNALNFEMLSSGSWHGRNLNRHVYAGARDVARAIAMVVMMQRTTDSRVASTLELSAEMHIDRQLPDGSQLNKVYIHADDGQVMSYVPVRI